MSILMEGKDYAPDGKGGVASLTGEEGLLGEVLFRLSVRRGSFPLMPELGSRLYLLAGEKPSARAALAGQYAAEALRDLADVTVTGAEVTDDGGRLRVRVELERQGKTLQVEVEE